MTLFTPRKLKTYYCIAFKTLTYTCSLSKMSGRSNDKQSLSRYKEMFSDLVNEHYEMKFDKLLPTHNGGSESEGHDLAKVISDYPEKGVLSR